MNYRHAYHAGNFADVLKHALLCWVVRYLQQKEAPLALIDTHAGRGLYDLTGPEAAKTGEAKDGVLRLLARTDTPEVFVSYLDVVRAFSASASPQGGEAGARGTRATDEGSPTPTIYPGSAALMTALARPADRIVAIELHPEEATELKRTLLRPGTAGFQPALSPSLEQVTRRRGDAEFHELANSAVSAPPRAFLSRSPALPAIRIFTGDGYAALLKLVPPREKRGLVLIDPPFETPDEFERLAKTFIAAHRKWPAGVYMLWFPIKHPNDAARFAAELTNAGIRKLTLITLEIGRTEGLSATGLVLCNAPFTLEAEWRAPLGWLAQALAQGPAAAGAITELARG